MDDNTAKGLAAGDTVTFKKGMRYSGTYALAGKPEYFDVFEGGSGYFLYLQDLPGQYHCSMFEDPVGAGCGTA